MAYRLFGGKPADFTVDTTPVNATAGGTADALVLVGAVDLVAWTAMSGGSQVTDLLLFVQPNAQGATAPSGIFPSQPDGTVLVWAPDTVGQLWVTQSGTGTQRWLIEPIDLNERLSALEGTPYIPTSQKGANNGVATLDATGKVPSGQLPSGTGGVASVNTLTGAVVLDETNTGFVPNSRKVLAGTGLTQSGTGALTGDVTLTPVIGTTAGTLAAGNDARFGTTGTSPRPVYAVVLSNDAPADRKAAAASDPNTWVCDGTNDEVQINLAITAAAPKTSYNAGMPAGALSLGKAVLSGGRFNIGAAGIKMRTAVHLEGAGIGATELRAVACNQPGLISLAAVNDHLCQLTDFYMNGNSGSGGTCSAIMFDMTGSGNTSAYPDTNPDSQHLIENLSIDEFRGTGRHGIYLFSTGTANNRGNMVKNIQVRDCTGGCGIIFDGSSDSYIEACHIGGSGDSGIRVAGGNTKLIGNKTFYSNANGVWVTSGRVNITGHESQDDSTGYFFDGVPGTAVGLVSDTSDVAGIRISNDRLQVIGFNVFVRGGGRYATQQRGLWYDGAFTNCAIIGNVENANMTTPISGTVPTGTNFVTVS